MIVCTKCEIEKPTNSFYTKGSGLRTVCKVCSSTDTPKSFAHAWYLENFDTEELSLFSTLKNLCTKAKFRTKEFSPDVTWEILYDIWVEQNGKCIYSGVPLTNEANHPHKVSLDRICSTEGYVVGNLQLVSASVNRMKQEFSEEFFLNMCTLIAANTKDNL